MLRVFVLVALALLVVGCGGEDEVAESPGCTSLLDSLAVCLDEWCAGAGGGSRYCTCYEQEAAVVDTGDGCQCGPAGSHREAYRTAYCGQELPAGITVDCPATLAEIERGMEDRCG